MIFLKAGDWTIGSVSESSLTKAANNIQVIASIKMLLYLRVLTTGWVGWKDLIGVVVGGGVFSTGTSAGGGGGGLGRPGWGELWVRGVGAVWVDGA